MNSKMLPSLLFAVCRIFSCSGEEKDKMLNILKRLEESEELREPAEQEVGPSLEDRLADLDLGKRWFNYEV